jgi:Zn-dependent protease with chaperone function
MGSTQNAGSAPQAAGTRISESFYTAQKRNRRATWRMTAICVVAALAMGIPLTLVLTPLMYAFTLITADIINFFIPVPAAFWDGMNSFSQLALRVGDYVINHKGHLDPAELVFSLVLVLGPGIAATFFLWMGVRALFRRGGVGGTLAALAAREPNRADLKELQLADVVDEMAIAAGVPSPKVMLVDSPGANAATIGTSALDARLVISRRLLDDLSRNELQAVLGHLIASIANDDLRIAFTVTSVFESCGLLVTLINAPFGKQARSSMWRVLRYALKRGTAGQAPETEADAVAALLSGSVDPDKSESTQFLDSLDKNRPFLKRVGAFVLMPLFFTNMVIELTLWIFLSVILGPCIALVWRTRRYLADASAVQLNRNPSDLADALRHLSEDSTTVLGGEWTSHLFLMNPKGDRSLAQMPANPERIQRAVQAWVMTAPQGAIASASTEDVQKMRAEIIATELAAVRGDAAARARMVAFGKAVSGMQGVDVFTMAAPAATRQNKGATGLATQSFVSFHPSLKRRLRKLERMGAHYTPEAHARNSVATTIGLTILYIIIVPLLTAAGVAIAMAMVMMIMMNMVFLGMWMMVIHAIFTWLAGRH